MPSPFFMASASNTRKASDTKKHLLCGWSNKVLSTFKKLHTEYLKDVHSEKYNRMEEFYGKQNYSLSPHQMDV